MLVGFISTYSSVDSISSNFSLFECDPRPLIACLIYLCCLLHVWLIYLLPEFCIKIAFLTSSNIFHAKYFLHG